MVLVWKFDIEEFYTMKLGEICSTNIFHENPCKSGKFWKLEAARMKASDVILYTSTIAIFGSKPSMSREGRKEQNKDTINILIHLSFDVECCGSS